MGSQKTARLSASLQFRHEYRLLKSRPIRR
jgi:hypothetical protein